MSDCNGSHCRDWVITLAHDGSITAWGWAAIVVIAVVTGVTWLAVLWLLDKLTLGRRDERRRRLSRWSRVRRAAMKRTSRVRADAAATIDI